MEKKHELAAGPSIQGDGIAETTTAIEVFSGPGMSINLRFCLMKEVAAYKAQQGQAIADLNRNGTCLKEPLLSPTRQGWKERASGLSFNCRWTLRRLSSISIVPTGSWKKTHRGHRCRSLR